jgi:hypothetical protein
LADISKRPELFETVLVAPEFALGVVSIPLSTLPRGGEAATAEELLDRIGLIPHARFPSEALSKALTALVVNESVDEVVDWLATPPDEVELNRFEVRAAAPYATAPYIDYDVVWAPEPPRRIPSPAQSRPKPKIQKASADALDLQAAMGDVAADAVVPFARSPVDITSLSELLQGSANFSAWVVSPRTNPFLLVELLPGYLLVRAVQGVGQGIRRGLSDGVYYKLLQLFKVPDDWRGPERD